MYFHCSKVFRAKNLSLSFSNFSQKATLMLLSFLDVILTIYNSCKKCLLPVRPDFGLNIDKMSCYFLFHSFRHTDVVSSRHFYVRASIHNSGQKCQNQVSAGTRHFWPAYGSPKVKMAIFKLKLGLSGNRQFWP